jgi:hypothetical protein
MVVRLAETGPGEPVRFECGSPSCAACPMKPDDRRPNTKGRQSIPARKCVILPERCALRSHRDCQLALRTSVSSTSVTAITPGAGCSITSAATVSTNTGATGRFTFRAAFFTGARLALALAAARFAVLATLRALPRLAELGLSATFLAFVLLVPSYVWP